MTKRSRSGSRSSKKSSGSIYKKAGKIVKITWEDAYSGQGWRDREDIQHVPHTTDTVGMVHQHDKDGILVYQSWSCHDATSGRFFVPSGMIRKIEVLL